MGFDDSLGGGGKEQHGDTWAQTPRRRRQGDGGVSSKGRRGAWRAREGARASGFELNQGRESGFGRGRDAWGSRWQYRRDDGGDGNERREQRREME